MDGTIVDISNAGPPLSFYNQSKGMEEVIPRLNLFAEEINEKVFNRKTAVRQLPQQRVPTQRAPQYMHPERLLSGEFVESEEDAEGGKTPFVMSRSGEAGPGFWKSRTSACR